MIQSSTLYAPRLKYSHYVRPNSQNHGGGFGQLERIFHASYLRKDIHPWGVLTQSQSTLKL